MRFHFAITFEVGRGFAILQPSVTAKKRVQRGMGATRPRKQTVQPIVPEASPPLTEEQMSLLEPDMLSTNRGGAFEDASSSSSIAPLRKARSAIAEVAA